LRVALPYSLSPLLIAQNPELVDGREIDGLGIVVFLQMLEVKRHLLGLTHVQQREVLPQLLDLLQLHPV